MLSVVDRVVLRVVNEQVAWHWMADAVVVVVAILSSLACFVRLLSLCQQDLLVLKHLSLQILNRVVLHTLVVAGALLSAVRLLAPSLVALHGSLRISMIVEEQTRLWPLPQSISTSSFPLLLAIQVSLLIPHILQQLVELERCLVPLLKVLLQLTLALHDLTLINVWRYVVVSEFLLALVEQVSL